MNPSARSAQGIPFPPLSSQPSYGRFGRFGRFHDDGLLTVDVNPRGFSYADCLPPFRVLWGEASAPLAAVVPKIDPTEKQLTIQGGGEGAPRLIRYSLLFPGVAAAFGRRMVLHFLGKDNVPLRCAIDPSRVKRGEGILIVPGDRFPSSPLLVMPPPQTNLRVWYDGANLTVEGSEELGEVRFITLAGLGTLDSLASAWERAGRLRDLPVPVRTRTRSVVDPQSQTVLMTETFDGGVAPVSPLLLHAVDEGYPARLSGKLVRSGILTRWGEFGWIDNVRSEIQLPLPPTETGLPIRPAVVDSGRLRQRDALIALDPVGKPGAGMVDTLETLVALQKTSPFLPADVAATLPGRWATAWKQALARESVQAATEPITGHSFSGFGARKGDREVNVGIGTGAARAVAALGTYVRGTGDWKFVREQSAWVARSRRFCELAEDWVWMVPAEGDYGGGTGDGDALASHYAAAVSERMIATGLDDESGQARASIRMARLAVGLVARLTIGEYAARTRQVPEGRVVYGYHETKGFLAADPASGDPALVSGVLGDAFSADALSALYGGLVRDSFRNWLAAVSAARPRWFDPRGIAVDGTRHGGNSLRVVWPHILHRIRAGGEGSGVLWPRWDIAMGNRRGGLTALPVWSELTSLNAPVRLLAWGKSGYVDAALDGDSKGVWFRFYSQEKQNVVIVLECRAGCRPDYAERDGMPVGVRRTESRCEVEAEVPAGVWMLRVRWSGTRSGAGPVLSPGPVPKPILPAVNDLAPRNPAW